MQNIDPAILVQKHVFLACEKLKVSVWSLVVRALERYSKDPGSSPGGDACFSH